MLDNGIILENNSIREIDKIEFLYRKSFFDSDQLNIILTPTFDCNLTCPYCFEVSNRSIAQCNDYYDSILKFAKKYFKSYRYVNISLFGGEPLIEFDKLDILLNKIKYMSDKYNFIFGTSITTNGTLINKKILDKLVNYNCKTIQITLDGSKETHDTTRKFKNGLGSFDKLVNIINEVMYQYIDKKKFKFILRVNLNNNTVEEISDALSRVDKRLRKNISLVLRPVYNTDSYNKINSNNFSEIRTFYEAGSSLGYSIMKNNYFYRSCEACGDENFFYITPDLNVRKCINNMSFNNAKIGRLTEDGDYVVDLDKVTEWYKAADCFSDSKCRKCKILPDCLGGCILYKSLNGERKCSHFNLVSLPYFYE